MKIKSIKAIAVNLSPKPKTQPRVELDPKGGYFVNPMDRYKYDPKYRSGTNWTRVACVVTAEDGTWGLGTGGKGAGTRTRRNIQERRHTREVPGGGPGPQSASTPYAMAESGG